SLKKLPAILLLLIAFNTQGQFPDPNAKIYDPVKWSYNTEQVEGKEFDLLITAKIEKGWHVYSQFIEDGGPIPTTFRLTLSDSYSLTSKVIESSAAVSAFDPNLDIQIAWHQDEVVFRHRFILSKNQAIRPAVLEFIVCNAERCLPRPEVECEFMLNSGS